MTDTKPTLEQQKLCIRAMYGLVPMENHGVMDAILASLEELKRIREAKMPVEPECIALFRDGINERGGGIEKLLAYIDALQAVIQRKEAELSDAVHLNDDQAQRVFRAEAEASELQKRFEVEVDAFYKERERAESAERERDALVAVVEKCKVALDKHEDGGKGWIGDAHVAAKEAIRNAAIDNAMDEGGGK
jgi:hypothetical protein